MFQRHVIMEIIRVCVQRAVCGTRGEYGCAPSDFIATSP